MHSTDDTPAPPSSAQLSALNLLDKTAVCELLALSERTLENMVNDDAFPPSVRLGRKVYWSRNAVRAWQQRMFAAQEAWSPAADRKRVR